MLVIAMQRITFSIDDENAKKLRHLVIEEKGKISKQSEWISEILTDAIKTRETASA